MSTAGRIHGPLLAPEKSIAQSHIRNTRLGENGHLESRTNYGGTFGGSKTTSLARAFTGNGVNWSDDIWSASATTKGLGSIGCETVKFKNSHTPTSLAPPCDPWNKKPSTWALTEQNAMTTTKGIASFTNAFPRENKPTPTPTSSLPPLQTNINLKNNFVSNLEHSRPFIGQAIDPNLTGRQNGHLQSSTPTNSYSFDGASEFVGSRQSWTDDHFDDWEHVTVIDEHVRSFESHHTNGQSIQPYMQTSMPPDQGANPIAKHFLPISSWPRNDPLRQPTDEQRYTKDAGGNSYVYHSTNDRIHTLYADHETFDLSRELGQARITDHAPTSSAMSKHVAEARGPSRQAGHAVFAPEYHMLTPQPIHSSFTSDRNNASYSWDPTPCQPFADQFHIPRALRAQQQATTELMGAGSRNQVDETEGLFGPPMYRSNSLVPYRNRPDPVAQNTVLNQGKGREFVTSSQDQDQYLRQQMQQAMFYPMRGCYPYHVGFGYHDSTMTNYTPYIPFSQLVLQPRPPSLGLIPQAEADHGFRSALLDEFRNNVTGSRRFELRDIYGHIVEFSGDQQGARFIQTKLETANSAEKDRIFRELARDAVPLMKDVFGNWVIQKFFEHGDQHQKRILVGKMKGQVLELTIQMYGCRVVQRALEHALVDEKVCLVKELEHHVLRCVKDQHGNHVIQKAIELLPIEYVQFIHDALVGQIQHLATHNFGCRVVQRLLERSESISRANILQELHACAMPLIGDQYGNYVIQNVLQHGDPDDRTKLNTVIKSHLVLFSKQKYASNVVEASLKFGTNEFRHEIMLLLTTKNERGENELGGLLKDAFGNYVIQKLLNTLSPDDHAYLSDSLKTDVSNAGQMPTSYKQVNNVAKKMLKFDSPFHNTAQHTQPNLQPSCMDSSARSTPPLSIDGAQSPFSSSLPSTFGDVVPPYLEIEQHGHVVAPDTDIKIEITHT